MKEFDYETIVSPPEFEQRCDNFIKAVRDELPDKYSYLNVRPLNITKIQLKGVAADIEELEKIEEPDPSVIKTIDYLYGHLHRLDATTARGYVAMVGLYGKDRNPDLIMEQILDAADDLDILSLGFKGYRIYPTLPEDLISDIELSAPPQASIFYRFLDEQRV